jgi:hypothetical protein
MTRLYKMTPEKVMEIRELYEKGRTQRSLAKDYGISAVQIGRIVRGESWAGLPTRQEIDALQDALQDAKPVDLPTDLLENAVDEFMKKRSY